MTTLIKRNTKIYFRDKVNIVFSMLSVMIMIALYAMFLGNAANWGTTEIRDSWLMSGVVAVASVTTSLGAFSIMIEDKVNKTGKGFYASPVKRSHITAAYIISPFVVGVIMTTLTAFTLSVYIIATGGSALSISGYFSLAGIILLSSISSTAMVCFIVSFLKSNSAYNTVSTIIGTLVGFLMGIYMPIGIVPGAVQVVMMLFPPSHAAMLFRQILMEHPMQCAFEGAPAGYLESLQQTLGIVFSFGEVEIAAVASVAYLMASAILFFGLSVVNVRKSGK